MSEYYANDKYSAVLTAGYTAGQSTLYVSAVPDYVPTVLVAAKGTDKETIFKVTSKTTNSLTGVSRLRGANVNLDAQTPLTCLNSQEFVNQFERASGAEVNAGTDDSKIVTPKAIAESHLGVRAVSVQITDADNDAETGNGKAIINIPTFLDGCVLKRVAASVTTAPTGAAISIQIHNVTESADMLSTALTIDAGESDSSTAESPAKIDEDHDDVATGDVLRIDVDQVGSATPGAGLVVRLEFEKS